MYLLHNFHKSHIIFPHIRISWNLFTTFFVGPSKSLDLILTNSTVIKKKRKVKVPQLFLNFYGCTQFVYANKHEMDFKENKIKHFSKKVKNISSIRSKPMFYLWAPHELCVEFHFSVYATRGDYIKGILLYVLEKMEEIFMGGNVFIVIIGRLMVDTKKQCKTCGTGFTFYFVEFNLMVFIL